MRPWLNWIEQQISNLWVAGSSPAGRATKIKSGSSRFYFCGVILDENRKKLRQQRQVRQQVDLINVVQSNRYGCRAGKSRASPAGRATKIKPAIYTGFLNYLVLTSSCTNSNNS